MPSGEGGQGPLTGWPPAAWARDSTESHWHQLRPGICSGRRCQGHEGGLSPAWHLDHVTAPASGQAGVAKARCPHTCHLWLRRLGRQRQRGVQVPCQVQEIGSRALSRLPTLHGERPFTVSHAGPFPAAPWLPHGGGTLTVSVWDGVTSWGSSGLHPGAAF